MSKKALKNRPPKEGLASLPSYLKAKNTAVDVLKQLHVNGAIAQDQIDSNIFSVTEIINISNDRQEDYWKSVFASVNARASHTERQAVSARFQSTLFAWLDRTKPNHRGNLDDLADKAHRAGVVQRSIPWIRKQITEWGKLQSK